MGTGPFALEILKGLKNKLPHDRLIVYTKVAKRSGRGMKTKDGCVAEYAREAGLALFQPPTLRDEAAASEFLSLKAELVVVASYGLLLPKYVLDAPRCGCVNVHASLLPAWRGAAPINRAVLNGDRETGITLMQMDEGLDTGDIIAFEKTEIREEENAGELAERLSVLGKELLLANLDAIFSGKINRTPQDHKNSTYAAKIGSDDQVLDFSLSAREISRRIRALSPLPGALCKTKKDGKILKIFAAAPREGSYQAPCGEILSTKPEVLVQTGDGVLSLMQVQPEGKAKMSAADAVNGRKLSVGDLLV